MDDAIAPSQVDMTDKIEKTFTLGGSVEKALKGDYPLSVNSVFREAFSLTAKNFLYFTPAIATFLIISAAIFFIALNVQGYNLESISQAFSNPETLDIAPIQAVFIAVFSAEVICSPLFAGLGLMSMSHAAGLKTRFLFLLKGFQYTIPVITVTLLNLIIQAISSALLEPLSLYFSLAFTHAILLICEKRLPLHQAMLVSLKATNKKLLSLFVIFAITTILLLFAFISGGVGLIFVLPFYMHVKGVVYRNMFGIKLSLVSSPDKSGPQQHFDA
jgi:hypothetical protein